LFLTLILLGLGIGALGGFLGIGGGLLMTLALLEIFEAQGIPEEIRYHLAFGTSLVGIIGTAISSTWAYHRVGRVLWKIVLTMTVAALLTSFIGSKLSAESPAAALRVAFIVFCVLTAGLMVLRQPTPRPADHAFSVPKLIVIGSLAGLLSAYLGVAGGALMVPLLVMWAHVPAEYVPGSSNAVGFFTSVFGALGYAIHGADVTSLPAGSWGFIVPAYAVPLFIGALAGGPLGSWLNRKYGRQSFRWAFAVFLLVVASKMIWFS
jgi:uncharacterized membrane protein YfcA